MKKTTMITERIDREIGKIIESIIDINHDTKAAQSKIWNNLSFIEYDIEELGDNGDWCIAILQETVINAKRSMSNINNQNIKKKLRSISMEFASGMMLRVRMGLAAL